MKLSNFIDGLQILAAYYNNRDGFHIGAEHDQFYAYKTDRSLTDPDRDKLIELGWFQPDQESDDYDPENGWSAFT